MRSWVIQVVVCAAVFRTGTPNRTTLNVGILLELTDNWYQSFTKGFIYIFEKVFEDIRRRHDILPEFEFNLTVKDTKVRESCMLK